MRLGKVSVQNALQGRIPSNMRLSVFFVLRVIIVLLKNQRNVRPVLLERIRMKLVAPSVSNALPDCFLQKERLNAVSVQKEPSNPRKEMENV